ncbi:MAG: sigma-70 family RNA polymerase sigma factor [Candidatus Eremiobacteraeota bacterium]|nr:sigma-70 family RNA polymerase sigma factor [Candidatus Eremiobacteraeota bacterium]
MSEHRDERETKIRSLLPLVRRIARRINVIVAGSEIDDLIGDGCIGLIRAVDSFDPTRGPTLEHYAGKIVAGMMLNGLRRLDPVSERVRREIREADAERYRLACSRGELPSAREMEERRPALRRANAHVHRYVPLSLDAPLPETEFVRADWNADPARIAGDRSEHSRVRAALETLSPRQRKIVALHYFGDVPLRAIGQCMNISAQRASQLHLGAIAKLRKQFDAAAAH